MAPAEAKFPFARELREQHDALRAAVRWFLAEAERESDARGFLLELREQLIQHFRFEERNEFGGCLNAFDPEVHRAIQELLRQHRAIEERLDALLARVEPSGNDPRISAALHRELDEFFSDLRRHDAEENALLARLSRVPADLACDLGEP